MAYVALDKDGAELTCGEKPKRQSTNDLCWFAFENFIIIPKGSIEKLIGKKLTWEDEPVELKEV